LLDKALKRMLPPLKSDWTKAALYGDGGSFIRRLLRYFVVHCRDKIGE